jgi:protein gp37
LGDNSTISWTDATWNPVFGCSKVSPGCAHCYAETFALTRMKGKREYTGLPWTPENATVNVKLRPERLDQPIRWKRPRLIFVNSLSDLFHEQVPDDFIDEVFGVMAACRYVGRDAFPGHRFQVLTKRPERMRAYLSTDRREAWAKAAAFHGGGKDPDGIYDQTLFGPQALPNVWVGTSVENQHWADVRVRQLLQTPAAVRFLSMEPLLGPVDLDDALVDLGPELNKITPRLDWVIVGGESGPVHRPMKLEWVRQIKDQCERDGVAFFLKQLGVDLAKELGAPRKGDRLEDFPPDLRVQDWPLESDEPRRGQSDRSALQPGL